MDNCDMPGYSDFLREFAKAKRIPLSAQFELTARCNFNCRMCYIHMEDQRIKELGEELSTEEWLRIAQEAKEAGTLYLTLTGGEIFTRTDFRELYSKLTEMGFLISLMTNASRIDENIMSWLKKRPPYMIRITLYGSNNDTYRSVCKVENGFDRVNRAIDLICAANIPISLKSVIIKNNAPDIQNMYKYAASKKLSLETVLGINKPVRGAVSEADKVRFEPWLEESSNSTSGSYILRDKQHGPFIHHHKYLDDCGPYGHTFNVTWDGHMLLCSFMTEPYTDLRKNSVNDAWIELLKQTEMIKKPEKCLSCKYEEYCMRCPGILAAECGSYNIVTDTFCERAKRLYRLFHAQERKEAEHEKDIC